MNRKKLSALKRRAEEFRRKKEVKSREMERLARSIGRRPAKRGHENYWVSDILPGKIAIPHHSKPLTPGTKQNILNDLEGDVYVWEEILDAEEIKKNNGHT